MVSRLTNILYLLVWLALYRYLEFFCLDVDFVQARFGDEVDKVLDFFSFHVLFYSFCVRISTSVYFYFFVLTNEKWHLYSCACLYNGWF